MELRTLVNTPNYILFVPFKIKPYLNPLPILLGFAVAGGGGDGEDCFSLSAATAGLLGGRRGFFVDLDGVDGC